MKTTGCIIVKFLTNAIYEVTKCRITGENPLLDAKDMNPSGIKLKTNFYYYFKFCNRKGLCEI